LFDITLAKPGYIGEGEGHMTAHRDKFVAYYRVSTDRQRKSGLGLEAQRKAVHDYLNGGTWSLVGDFTEIESGKRNKRPELEKALAVCKRQKAKLVIAKLDRLSRNLAFIATLMDSGVEFVAVDNPHANKLTVHILAAVAQHEREMIAQRTKDALQAAKARGVVLGNPRVADVRDRAVASVKADADHFVKRIDRRCITPCHCTVTQYSRCCYRTRRHLGSCASWRDPAACRLGG
jgi:DNA invertase Pin-like site-specific DNA recombinase